MHFQDLIRKALKKTGMTLQEASEACGRNPDWLKTILRKNNPVEPGVGAAVRLAHVLKLDRQQLLDALEKDYLGSIRERREISAATDILRSMTPEERAAFIASHQRPKH